MAKKILSAGKLAEKAKWDRLTSDEIADVAQRIKDIKPGNKEDLPCLIFALGRSGADQYREMVEKFLYYTSGEWVCIEALRALCTYWCFTADYLKELKMFIKGAEWDDTDDVRLWAMSIAGDFLKENYDRELLYLLLEVFENLGKSTSVREIRDYARSLLQSAAYEAIATAMGKKWNEIPDGDFIEAAIENKQLDLLDLTVIQKAHQMIEKKN